MVSKPGKPKSKRTPVRLRHKIEKAGAAKQRKQRKQAKKNPEWRSRLKKDPGIPNLFPYKDKILHEIEEKKRLKEEEYAKKREEARSRREDAVVVQSISQGVESGAAEDADLIDEDDNVGSEDQDDATTNPMSALLASARARVAEYEETEDDDDDAMDEDTGGDAMMDMDEIPTRHSKGSVDSSRRAFDKVYKNVLQSADIILYVLDARDPNGTRSREIEREVASADGGSKRLILILNKIDLVPAPVLKAWLKHLRRSFPTLPLRASLPASNAKTFDHKALTVKGTSETLLRALKSYAQSKQLKRSISVGIIGYPNVGKSSVVNALTSRLPSGSRSASVATPVGAEAGVTTALREIKVDNKLKLLDSPGIVFPSTKSSTSVNDNPSYPAHLTPSQASAANLALLSALPPSSISDPIAAVSLLIYRLSQPTSALTLSDSSETNDLLTQMLQHYNIPPSTLPASARGDGDITNSFLVEVARRRGRLGKGGVPNVTAAAMNVLVDWRDGRIRGWMDVPATSEDRMGLTTGTDTMKDQKEIVKEWGKEFSLEGLWGDDDKEHGDEMEQDI